MRRTRSGERVFHFGRGDYVIVLQENHRSFRVAKIERLARSRTGYMCRLWDFAGHRWTGETLVMFGNIVGPSPGGASRIEEVATNLQAFANMRAAAIRSADQDMLAAACHLCDLEVLPQPVAREPSVRRKAA